MHSTTDIFTVAFLFCTYVYELIKKVTNPCIFLLVKYRELLIEV